MKAKTLVFREGEPFLNYPTEIAKIQILTMDSHPDRPAHYEVGANYNGFYKATFWAMNRGIALDEYCNTLEDAKKVCQAHYDSLINENCDQTEIQRLTKLVESLKKEKEALQAELQNSIQPIHKGGRSGLSHL